MTSSLFKVKSSPIPKKELSDIVYWDNTVLEKVMIYSSGGGEDGTKN